MTKNGNYASRFTFHVSRFTPHAPRFTLLVVAALYIVGLLLLSPDALTHHDEGAKYLQVRNLRIAPVGLDWSINYPARGLDPQLQFVPFHPKQHYIDSKGRIYLQWPIFLGLLTRVFWKILGFWGLYVVPLVAGLATLWVSYLLALAVGLPRHVAWLAIPIVGLATPLSIYSLLYFEHTLATLLVALSTLFGVSGLRTAMHNIHSSTPHTPHTSPLLSGGLLAIAVYFRSELYVLALVMVLVYAGIGWRWGLWRWALSWVVGFAVMLVPLWAFYAINEGNLLPTHALWYFAGGDPSNSGGTPRPGLPPLRYIASAGWGVIPAFLFGPSTAPFVPAPPQWVGLAGLAGIGLCVLSALGRLVRTPLVLAWRMVTLLVGLVLLLASTIATLLLPQDYRNLHGFLLASPFVALALWPVGRTEDEGGGRTNDEGPMTESQKEDLSPTFIIGHWSFVIGPPSSFVQFTTLLYVVLHVIVISALSGLGPISLHEWGQRYLLPAYPLLSVVTLVAIYNLLKGIRRNAMRGLVVACVALWVALVLVGVGFTARGYVAMFEERTQVAGWQALVGEMPSREPLVTDVWWLPLNLAAAFYSRPMMLAENNERLVQWGKEMQAKGVRNFGFATNDPGKYKTFESLLPNIHADGLPQESQGIWLQRYEIK